MQLDGHVRGFDRLHMENDRGFDLGQMDELAAHLDATRTHRTIIFARCFRTVTADVPTELGSRVGDESPVAGDADDQAPSPRQAFRRHQDRTPWMSQPVRPPSFRYSAVAAVPDATEEADGQAPECAPDTLPDDTLIYTLPSRYCLSDMAAGSVTPITRTKGKTRKRRTG